MYPTARNLFPYLVLLTVAAAIVYAASFGTLPPADFSFNNGNEVRTIDPAKATGNPENRIINALFEGLLRNMPVSDTPDENGMIALAPAPGMAELPEISDDGKTYTFKMRPHVVWSNGEPVTAGDFVWSWRRMLHPETASEYAYQLYYLKNAEAYNTAVVHVGDRVEVELPDRRDPLQTFPRGTILRGIVREIKKPPQPAIDESASKEDQSRATGQWKDQWVYVIDVKPRQGDQVDWDAAGETRSFSKEQSPEIDTSQPVERCLFVLLDFSEVGALAQDDETLVVTLKNRTPYFDSLVAFYPLYPANPRCVEQFGSPRWTKPENIISNGPYLLKDRRLRDRIRMRKNPLYWDADNVQLEVIDAYAIGLETTGLNMYLRGTIDWETQPPITKFKELRERDDWYSAPMLTVYFYRLNTAVKPLDDKRVRQALNLAIDKQQICDFVTQAGEIPATGLVPPGLKGYKSPVAEVFNIEQARKLLADAGYPGGKGFPKLAVLFNTLEQHRDIAEVLQQQWKTNLGIDIELKNMEWGVYLDTTFKKDYDIARAGWIGDYPDPNTFLDMWVTDGPQNNTNWSNAEFDKLIEDAAAEGDPDRRMKMLFRAEEILIDEVPFIPIYFYVSKNMVKPHVKGFSNNILDNHWLHLLRVEKD